MDFNTKLVKEGVAQIANMLSDLVVTYVQEEESVTLGEIEQSMRQMLQEVGRQALGQVLGKSDPGRPQHPLYLSAQSPLSLPAAGDGDHGLWAGAIQAQLLSM